MRIWKLYTALPEYNEALSGIEAAALEVWEKEFATTTGGFTRYETHGAWVSGGELYKEDGHVYEVIDFAHTILPSTMKRFQESLRVLHNQQTVLLTLQQGEVI